MNSFRDDGGSLGLCWNASWQDRAANQGRKQNNDLAAKLTRDSSEALGFELVEEKAFGKSVVKLVYVLKLESHPLVWEFHFYKPKEKWFLARLGFDEDLRKLGNGR